MSQRRAIEERTPGVYAGCGTGEHESDATLEQLFLELTVRTPAATALLGDEGSLSYSELLIRAQNIATLLHKRGVRPGDLVGVVARRSFATISAIVGALLAGAVYVMFDVGSQGEEALRRQVAVSRVRLLLADGSGGGVLELPWAGSAAVVDLQTIEREIMPLFAQMQLPKIAPDGPATMVFQRESEGVLITHRSLATLCFSLRSSSDLLHLSVEDRLLLQGDSASHVWHLQLWSSLLSGAALVLAPALRSQTAATVCTQILTSEELEGLIAQHPTVQQCAVVPLPHDEPGWCAFVSLRGADAQGESKIRAHILAHVPQASHPRFLLLLRSLPRDATGELDRPRLIEHARTLITGKARRWKRRPGCWNRCAGYGSGCCTACRWAWTMISSPPAARPCR